jgi:hypothetical protein
MRVIIEAVFPRSCSARRVAQGVVILRAVECGVMNVGLGLLVTSDHGLDALDALTSRHDTGYRKRAKPRQHV